MDPEASPDETMSASHERSEDTNSIQPQAPAEQDSLVSSGAFGDEAKALNAMTVMATEEPPSPDRSQAKPSESESMGESEDQFDWSAMPKHSFNRKTQRSHADVSTIQEDAPAPAPLIKRLSASLTWSRPDQTEATKARTAFLMRLESINQYAEQWRKDHGIPEGTVEPVHEVSQNLAKIEAANADLELQISKLQIDVEAIEEEIALYQRHNETSMAAINDLIKGCRRYAKLLQSLGHTDGVSQYLTMVKKWGELLNLDVQELTDLKEIPILSRATSQTFASDDMSGSQMFGKSSVGRSSFRLSHGPGKPARKGTMTARMSTGPIPIRHSTVTKRKSMASIAFDPPS